jgi:hypothetical protein
MQIALKIKDEATGGRSDRSFELTFPARRITVRELIEARVREEVENYHRTQPEVFEMLVRPALAERVLNGYKFKEKKNIDWREQCERAVRAFEGHGFIVLVDDLQAESLDQTIEIEPETRVTFLKLVPLVGG